MIARLLSLLTTLEPALGLRPGLAKGTSAVVRLEIFHGLEGCRTRALSAGENKRVRIVVVKPGT